MNFPFLVRLSNFAPEPGRRFVHGLALALALAVLSGLFRSLDLWRTHFDHPGWPYVVHHLSRLGLLTLLVPMVYGAGRLALPGPRRMVGPILDRFGHFIACATVGVALINIVFSVFGMLALFTFPLFITVGLGLAIWGGLVSHEIVVPLRLWGHELWRSVRAAPLSGRSMGIVLLIGLSVVTFIVHGVAEVMTLPLTNNDIPGGYLPYQWEVLRETHGFWPTVRFPVFTVLKGAGWSFFVMGLSDHTASPLANFLLFALLLALIAQIGSWVCGGMRVAWFGALTLCWWPLGISHELSLFKTHTAISASLIGALYWMVLYLAGLEARRPLPARGLIICFMALVTLYASNILLAVVVLLAPAWVYARWRGLDAATAAFRRVAFWSVATFAVLLGYAHIMSGHFDITFEFFDVMVDVETFSQWGSLFILKLQRVLHGHFYLVTPSIGRWVELSGHVLDGSLVAWRPLAIMIALGAMLLGTALWPPARQRFTEPSDPPHLTPATVLLIWGFACSGGVVMLVDHVSVSRTANFRFAFAMLAMLWMCGWSAAALGIEGARRRLFVVFALSLMAMPWPKSPTITGRDWRFLTGRESYLSMTEWQWPGVTPYWRISRQIAPDRRVLMLNWAPAAFMLPDASFERPLQNVAMPGLPILMYEDAEKGRAALTRSGIETVSIDLDAPLYFNVRSPLFHPDALSKHFRLLAHQKMAGSDLYLLTLRPDEGTPPPKDFLDRYARLFAEEKVAKDGLNWLHAVGECLWRLARVPGQPGTDIGGPQNFLASPAQRRLCEKEATR